MRLPNQDSTTGRSLKTTIQAFLGACLTFTVGLWLTIAGVPGCPEAIFDYVRTNFFGLATALGLSAGVASFIWNLFRKNIPNY